MRPGGGKGNRNTDDDDDDCDDDDDDVDGRNGHESGQAGGTLNANFAPEATKHELPGGGPYPHWLKPFRLKDQQRSQGVLNS